MDYPLLDIFLTTMWVFLWVLWFMLLFRVFADLLHDDTVSGWGKAGWSVFVIVLPFLGVFVYLIARGKSMGERALARAQRNDQEVREYVRAATGATAKASPAEDLSRLADLRKNGDITQEEYEQAKARVLV